MSYLTFRVEITRDEGSRPCRRHRDHRLYRPGAGDRRADAGDADARLARACGTAGCNSPAISTTLAEALAAIAAAYPETERIRCYEYTVDDEYPARGGAAARIGRQMAARQRRRNFVPLDGSPRPVGVLAGSSSQIAQSGRHSMAIFTHVTVGTNDLAKARAFYDACWRRSGYKRLKDLGDRGSCWGQTTEEFMVLTPADGKPASAPMAARSASRRRAGRPSRLPQGGARRRRQGRGRRRAARLLAQRLCRLLPRPRRQQAGRLLPQGGVGPASPTRLLPAFIGDPALTSAIEASICATVSPRSRPMRQRATGSRALAMSSRFCRSSRQFVALSPGTNSFSRAATACTRRPPREPS